MSVGSSRTWLLPARVDQVAAGGWVPFDLVESIGVRELRNNVAAILRRAAAGERMTVTVDGVPVAQVGPLEPEGSPTLDDLVATGLVQPPRRSRGPEPPDLDPLDVPVDIRIDDVLEALRGGT